VPQKHKNADKALGAVKITMDFVNRIRLSPSFCGIRGEMLLPPVIEISASLSVIHRDL